ncbi:MAG: site-2 protease family protein [Pirellulales bacterium]
MSSLDQTSEADDPRDRRENPYRHVAELPTLEDALGVTAAYRATDPPPAPSRRVMLPIALFLCTCGTTFLAGVAGWPKIFAFEDPTLPQKLHTSVFVWNGIEYMCAVMGILLAHEMGHFLMNVRYRISSSYPLFIPFPLLFTGTMGAVIVLDGRRANRRQLFDIGLAGPLAGLALIVPILVYGISHAQAVTVAPNGWGHIDDPLLVELLRTWLRPEMTPDQDLLLNPWLMAGWVGCLVTGLNMFPLSQLDGGHVLYCLLGKRAHYAAHRRFASLHRRNGRHRQLQLDGHAGAGDFLGRRSSADVERSDAVGASSHALGHRIAGDPGAVLHPAHLMRG